MFGNNKLIYRIVIAVVISLIVASLIGGGWFPYKKYYTNTNNTNNKQSFEMVEDSGMAKAPDSEELLRKLFKPMPTNSVSGKCGTMFGYNYQLPEEPVSPESLMPSETAYDDEYDPNAAQNTPYIFQYPFTGQILKSRPEQAGDMWRGDLMIEPGPVYSEPIYGNGDQLLHGAYSDYTKKSHELVGCNKWVRDSPIRVENEGIMMN